MYTIYPSRILWLAPSWETVVPVVLSKPAHHDVLVSKSDILHPIFAGFDNSLGNPQGEISNYRRALADGRGIHVREFPDYYAVHWDKFDPNVDWFNHLRYDAPEWGVLVSAAIGGLTGYATVKSVKDRQAHIYKGIGIGFLIGLVLTNLN